MLLAGVVSAELLTAAAAQAHAELVGSEPADGSRLDRSPAAVTLTFDEPVRPYPDSVRVTRARGGQRVDAGQAGQPTGRPDQLSVRLPAGLPPDSYAVAFGVLSDDGHPRSGVLTFVVGDGPLRGAGGVPADDRGADPVVAAGSALARWLGFAGALDLGALLFVLTCWPDGRGDRRARRLLLAGVVAAALGTLGSLLLQGPYGEQRGAGAALSPALLGESLSLPVGRLLVLRLGLLAVLGVLTPALLRGPDRPGSPARTAVTVLAVPLLASYAGAGHAGSGGQPTVTVVSTLLHLAAMGAWLGGLVVLTVAVLPRGRPAELARVLPPFSRLAGGCVLLLTLTGGYQAISQLGAVDQLWTTGYGRLLDAKLALVAVILLLGARLRTALRARSVAAVAVLVPAGAGPAAAPPPPEQPRRQPATRIAAAELALAGAVLVLSSVLMSSTPPRVADSPAHPDRGTSSPPAAGLRTG